MDLLTMGNGDLMPKTGGVFMKTKLLDINLLVIGKKIKEVALVNNKL